MDKKFKTYVDALFLDVPKSKKANKLKQELIQNMTEQSQAYLSEGQTKSQAYTQVLASFGDVDDIIAEAMIVDEDDVVTNDYTDNYSKRTTQIEAISAIIFLLAPVSLVLSTIMGYPIAGFVALPMLAIFGGILSLYVGAKRSKFDVLDDKTKNKTYNRIKYFVLSIIVLAVVVIYVLLGLFSEMWHPSWIIFFTIPVLSEILNTIFEIINQKGQANEE